MTRATRNRFVFSAGGLFVVMSALIYPARSYGETARVGFDVSYSVPCRDVTPEEFSEANPGSKIVEARFQVSSLFRRGGEKDIKQLMYVIWSPERRLRVVDFEPKTQVASEVTDTIQITEKGEDASTLDGSVSVQFSPLAGVQFSPSVGASKLKKQLLEQKYSKLPPKQLLLASGTTDREYGVFFKLKPSSQASLEGRKEFVCLFVVPEDWRGDYAYVECTAKPRSRSPWSTADDYGSIKALVGLYLEGDLEARRAVERLAHAYEAYLRAGGPTASGKAQPAGNVGGFFRRVPGLSLVESVIDDLAAEGKKKVNRKDQAWKSFQTALKDVGQFTG
jgi:hypothetical protein